MRFRSRAPVAAVLIAIVMFVAGCGGDDSDSPGGSGGEGEEKGASFTFVSFGGSYTDAEQKAWLDPFAQQTGAKFKVDGPPEPAKLQAQVEAGKVTWDVYESEPYFVQANCGKLFEKLNLDTAHIIPELNFSECGGPISLITNVLVYNKSRLAGAAPASYDDFFDAEKIPGKRAMVSFLPYGQLEAALLADGVAPDELYPLDVDRALRKLDTIRDDLVLWESGAQMQEQLESGSVVMGLAWNGRAYDAVRNGAKLGAVWEQNLREGTLLAVPKGSPNKKVAEQFISFAIQPKNQAALTELIPYSPTTEEAKPKLDKLAESWLPTQEDNYEQGLTIDMDWWADNYEAVNQKWTAWQAG